MLGARVLLALSGEIVSRALSKGDPLASVAQGPLLMAELAMTIASHTMRASVSN